MGNPVYPPNGDTPAPAAPSAPMDPAALLLWIKAALDPWANARKGYVSLAGDPGEVLEALLDSPKGFRIVLNWVGDEDQTGQAQAGITDQTWEVWVIKAKGLRLRPGDHLVSGDYPFLSLVSDIRAQVRAIRFPDVYTSIWPFYKGAKQFEPELAMALPTTGYKMTFEITAAVPFIQVDA